MNQLRLHKKIEEFFKAGIRSADINIAKELIANEDAKRFFFSQADESWLGWLWDQGFLNEIKNKNKESASTGILYRMPELEYLTRMVGKESGKVTEIINSIEISEANYNPEVINQFLWIMGSLPAEQIKTLTQKVRDERWIYLVRNFHKSGYEFGRIVEKLVAEKEADTILELAEAILAIKSKTEIVEKENSFNLDDPFYVSDLDASGIFEALADLPDSHKERALQISTDTMSQIIKLSGLDNGGTFEYRDPFALYDVDFFTIEIENKGSSSYREDIKNLVATIKKLVKATIGRSENPAEAKRAFEYINNLPPSRSMWRFKLFAMVQYPEAFKAELKKAFFRLFEVDNYYDIEGGTEYKKALKIGFSFLSDSDQRSYVANVFEYFSAKAEKDPDQAWHKRTGREILSMICHYLKADELKKCEEAFDGKCDEQYEPEPTIGKMHAGSVSHKSPVNLNDYTVLQIIENLKTEWTQDELNERFKDDDFFQPRGVEGLGDALKENIKKRTAEYLENIEAFFERDKIHSHYVYSLLRGIEEMLRNDKGSLDVAQTGQILGLLDLIKSDGIREPFEREDNKSWLSDWITVHKVMADVLLYIVESKDKREETHKEYRDRFRDLISYLLTIRQSPSKDDEKPEYGEPYHIAINSVRGRAYEAFVVFASNDGKGLLDDIKKLYIKTLADDSLAVRFVIGRYLATFYFRDTSFIVGLFPQIFLKDDPNKKDLYLATWEGYLSNTLYDKMFTELRDYYAHAITLNPPDYTDRKYLTGLDKSLAIHIALAFAHLDLEIDDPLFVQFWSKPNVKRQQEFISFIGSSCLSRDQAGDEWLKEHKVSKGKLLSFWDWALEHVIEPEVFSGFGFWVNPKAEILDDNLVIERMAKTLKKSNGNLDWDYALLRRLPVFAQKDGEKTLEVISNYLLDQKGDLNQGHRAPPLYDNELKEALKTIYQNGNDAIKQRVYDLINNLIEKGSSVFWDFKEVLN